MKYLLTGLLAFVLIGSFALADDPDPNCSVWAGAGCGAPGFSLCGNTGPPLFVELWIVQDENNVLGGTQCALSCSGSQYTEPPEFRYCKTGPLPPSRHQCDPDNGPVPHGCCASFPTLPGCIK